MVPVAFSFRGGLLGSLFLLTPSMPNMMSLVILVAFFETVGKTPPPPSPPSPPAPTERNVDLEVGEGFRVAVQLQARTF